MNELEKIQTAKETIKVEHEKMASMFQLVRILGKEVGPIKGHTYKATEDTGVACTIESFLIEEDKLKVRTNFDGDRHILELDSFRTEELADILSLMINWNTFHLQRRIDNLFIAYITENDKEPLYVSCCVKFLDNSPHSDVVIRLDSDLDVKDDTVIP